MPALMSYRSVVEPRDCDILGHMNVSRYFEACSDGVANLQTEIGLTAKDMREGRQLSLAVVRAESDFRAELQPGEAIYLLTDILAIGTKSMTLRHRLYRVSDKALCFETTFKGAMLNLATRRADAIPDDVREKAQAFLATPE